MHCSILGSFLKAKVQNGGYFLGLLKFHFFFGGGGCLKFLKFLGGRVDAGPEPTCEEKLRAPPPPPPGKIVPSSQKRSLLRCIVTCYYCLL